MIIFKTSREDARLIDEIAARAAGYAASIGIVYPVVDARMDLTAVHANGCPLRLPQLLAANEFDFAHDVLGIRKHLNRQTAQFFDHFHPRFAR